MTLDQAQAWAIIIASVGGAGASIMAAYRAGKANDNAAVAKNQTALNQQAVEKIDTKLEENNRMTAEIHGMSQAKAGTGDGG